MWRSLLFVPILNERLLEGAARRGADAVVLDLEAAVPADRKDEGLSALPTTISSLYGPGPDIAVRVNLLDDGGLADIAAATNAGADIIVLPKATTASTRRAASKTGDLPLIPLIEDPRGVIDALAIAEAAPKQSWRQAQSTNRDSRPRQGRTLSRSPAREHLLFRRLKPRSGDEFGVYLHVVDEALKLISVFDALKYDRADMNMLSGPMRNRVLSRLTPLGFRQVSGGVLENAHEDVRMYFPKFRTLGASPFDAMRDSRRCPQDYVTLTTTQTVCQLIAQHPTDEAVQTINALIVKHPANILRISDFLEKTEKHQAFASAIGHLKYVQRKAADSEPLRSRRALR